MKDSILVSVVIPSYNHSLYIKDCINSVLSQSYKNIEIIVVDDGSTDNTIDILHDFKDDITLISQENQGVSSALNNGVSSSNGLIISILASDDMYHPNKIEEQVSLLESTPDSEFCFCQALYFDSSPNNVVSIFPTSFFKYLVTERIFIKQTVPAGSIIFTRNLYNIIGGFNEKLKEEDWDFIIKASFYTRFTFLEKPLFYYRYHCLQTMVSTSRFILFKRKLQVLKENKKFVPIYIYYFSILIHFVYDFWLYLYKRFRSVIQIS